MAREIVILICIILIFYFSGCVKEEIKEKAVEIKEEISDIDRAIAACQQLCQARELEFLNQSPCLSNDLLGDGAWVCDIAHSPRLPMDNLPEKQCEAWRNGSAAHFVELGPDCKVIKFK